MLQCLRSVWDDSGKFAELLQLCWVLWILIYWRGLGFRFRFLSLRVSRFCLVFEFEYCWNWERASCWKPFASYSSNIDDDDVRGAGRPGGGVMKSLLGVLNRTETFALLFDVSSKNVLLYFLGFCIFLCCSSCPQRCCCCCCRKAGAAG